MIPFYYVFSLSGRFNDADDLRIVQDRSEALMFMHILNLRPRVVAAWGLEMK